MTLFWFISVTMSQVTIISVDETTVATTLSGELHRAKEKKIYQAKFFDMDILLHFTRLPSQLVIAVTVYHF